jgi:hypothetical protein
VAAAAVARATAVAAVSVAGKQSSFARVGNGPCGISQEHPMIDVRSYHGAVADSGSLADRRAQVEHEQQQRLQERQQQIALLTSRLSTPEERIRLWEKLHALTLPRSPTHKLLRIIAEHTELSLEQVLEVQRRSFAPRIPQNPAAT